MGSDQRVLRLVGVMLGLLLVFSTGLVLVESAGFLQGVSPVLGPVEALFGPVCHHLPERTLHTPSGPLPVCARCTGLYLGAATLGWVGIALRRASLRVLAGIAVIATAVGGMGAIVELLTPVQTSNPSRLILGALLGGGPALFVGLAARVCWSEAVRPAAHSPRD